MKNFWVSWYHNEVNGPFELHTPWWESGIRVQPYAPTICAAIKATSESNAKNKIYQCYDNPPDFIEFRFITEKEKQWAPYSDRFQKADWMKWE